MELRKPLFFLAAIAMVLAFFLEMGSAPLLRTGAAPGYGIAFTGLLDTLVVFVVGLMGLALIVPERVHGLLQGWIALIVSLLVLTAGIVMVFKAIGLLMLMIGLFLLPPFGTAIYVAKWGSFSKGAAALIIGWVMFLKLCFAGLLIFAHPRFLQNRSLILIILTSLIATFLVGLLHGWVPPLLVSITDVIGAIIVVILALIWAIFFLIFSVVSIVKSIV